MEKWAEIRRLVFVEGRSRRSVRRQFDLHWATRKKILEPAEPPGYRQGRPREKPKIGPFLPVIEEILRQDRNVHRKQNHSAIRILNRLRKEHGYAGGYTAVKEALREWRRKSAEVFVPLRHPPAEAQVDFGQADIILRGELATVALFVMTLPYSDAIATLNTPLESACGEDLQRTLRGKAGPKAELLAEERNHLLALPAEQFEARRVRTALPRSLSLVRFDRNAYSVPTDYRKNGERRNARGTLSPEPPGIYRLDVQCCTAGGAR